MVCEIHIPLLGMNMKEATIVNWLVEDGGQAEKDMALVEIETDKAVHEIMAPASGVLKIVREKGNHHPGRRYYWVDRPDDGSVRDGLGPDRTQ